MAEFKEIKFSPPDITDDEINEVIDTLKSGWITTGPKTKLFEKRISEYCNTSKTAALSSATAAMEMTLRMLGIGPGDEVITTAYTYSASASVIAHVGAKIVLIDTGKDSFHLNYNKISDLITKRTKAIIPVDIAGIMCDYDIIFEAIECKRKIFSPSNEFQDAFGRIIVVADAAHSFGASYKGKMSGEVADFTSFSFHAVKNLTTAEGGAVTWKEINSFDNVEIYNRYMLLSLHGQSKDALAKTNIGSWDYDIIATNYKCNMTDVSASLGLGQLKRYSETLKRRREIIEQYDALLSGLNLTFLRHYAEDYSSSGHLYMLRINGIDENIRNNIITEMGKKGVFTNVHYKPIPMHSAYKKLGFNINNYPNAFNMYKNELTLPLHTLLSDKDVGYVCNCLIEVMEKKRSDFV